MSATASASSTRRRRDVPESIREIDVTYPEMLSDG